MKPGEIKAYFPLWKGASWKLHLSELLVFVSQNLVTWPHLFAKETDKSRSCLLGSLMLSDGFESFLKKNQGNLGRSGTLFSSSVLVETVFATAVPISCGWEIHVGSHPPVDWIATSFLTTDFPHLCLPCFRPGLFWMLEESEPRFEDCYFSVNTDP